MLGYLLAGVSLGLSAGLTPGPLFATVLTQTLKYGRGEGVKTACTPLLTDLPIIVAATYLLANISAYKQILGLVAVAGSLFVAYLAYENTRSGLPSDSVDTAAANSIARGAAVNLLSPHPYLFWLTVGSPLLLKGWQEGPAYAAVFLASFYICLIGAQTLLAVLVSKSRRAFAGRAYIIAMRLLAAVLLVFAVLLFREGLKLLF